MKEINYDIFLDEWAEKCYKEMDKAKEVEEDTSISLTRRQYAKGYRDGISIAIAFLSVKEKRLKEKLEKESKE